VAFALVSVALGTLIGASRYMWLSEHFGHLRTSAGLMSSAERSPSPSVDGQ